MKICKKCKRNNDNDAKVCYGCGAALHGGMKINDGTVRKNTSVILWAAITSLVLVVIMLAVGFNIALDRTKDIPVVQEQDVVRISKPDDTAEQTQPSQNTAAKTPSQSRYTNYLKELSGSVGIYSGPGYDFNFVQNVGQYGTYTIVEEKTLSGYSALRTLDHLTGGAMLNLSFEQSTGSKNPTFIYDEKVKESKTVTTDYWEAPVYSLQTFALLPNEATETGTDSGSSNNWNTVRNKDDARKDAFNRAYDEAKDNALNKLNANLKTRNASDPGWVISGSVTYTELSWNTIPENSYSSEGKVFGFWTSTCTVTVTATAKIVKSASVSLYTISSEGHWQTASEETTHLSGVINNDELRMYCGNSFTISLTEAAKAEGYEITKVKVHYSGNNFVDNFGTLNEDKAYARFVDNEINLSDYELADQFVIGSTEVLQLPGMDFSADGETGWHQWAGEGRNSITLLLADYNVNYNLTSISYTYNYDSTPLDSEKFIIVDQIEVKCSKKKKAEFDFAKIYTEGGNMETSYCTVKHITFTGEAASDEAPVPGATAEGLKLYAGSKVTFKALDGYVINSISGDESLTFKGSKQTVEFTGLPEKTITAPIVVLYSKAAAETN